jgi:RNA polymerase sigma-70 factor (ECF subfamily)
MSIQRGMHSQEDRHTMTRSNPAAQGTAPAGGAASADDAALVALLRAGDQDAFAALVDKFYMPMLRLAMLYVSSRAVAEDVVQEAWLGVLQGLDRFEGRSSLKTWIFRILTNRAKTRGEREHRSIAFSSLQPDNPETDEPTIDPEQFWPADHPQWANGWVSYPRSWEGLPEEHALTHELRAKIDQAIAALPPNQREVITLRDIEGWSAEEARMLLSLSEANQRVLLHRARAKVRTAIDQYVNYR